MTISPDLLEDVPEHFTRFHFAGHEEDAQWLNRYLWWHFRQRGGVGKCLFNQEYVSTADMWLGDAVNPRWGGPVQKLHRQALLDIQQDNEGYIWTHQHWSHAHEHGWPFPMWTQAATGEEGYAAGWHFQTENGQGWVWQHFLDHFPTNPWSRKEALEGWDLENCASQGIQENRWVIEATGPSPAITTPAFARIDAANAPYLQLRWKREPLPEGHALPYVEWIREGETDFGPDRRVYIQPGTGNPDYEAVSGCTHSLITMHRHPKWTGFIDRIRICLAPGEYEGRFLVDSFFTVYDTRHSINNPIYILACWNYFRWTGDLAFLNRTINQMRTALRYQQTTMGGLEHNHIRNPWPGHGGLPGFTVNEDGTKTIHYGCGIGNNYWDLLPFGWDDLYATSQYYASLRAMAELEEAVRDHPGWNLPRGAWAQEPEALRQHAAAVKQHANELFWNAEKGRFIASIDKEGRRRDYGLTFVNLDAIWYGLASEEHAQAILAWLSGERIVAGDTSSTGDDIYHWRFGPRATTLRNIEWYGQGWHAPESIPFGGQVQDGGAVLGFSFYDLWARLHVRGADDAWQRLLALLDWEREVWGEGGYRPYYADGSRGTTLQGGGTAGGLGIDCEFWESSLVPAIVPLGFLGLRPTADALAIDPKLPAACPEIGAANLQYRGVLLDINATPDTITVVLQETPPDPLPLQLGEGWHREDTRGKDGLFHLPEQGAYRFVR